MKNSIRKYIVILFTISLWLILPKIARASGEIILQPKSVCLDYKSNDSLTIKIHLDDEGSIAAMETLSKAGVYSLPKEEFSGIGDSFKLSEAIVTVKSSGPEMIHTSFRAFAVLIPFGKLTVNEIDGKEIHAFNYVRFEFENGRLAVRRRAISKGDDLQKWDVFSKRLNEKEKKDGEISSAKNPLKID